MIRHTLLLATAASTTLAGPTHSHQAPETLDPSVPIALVSQQALDDHAFAQVLFQALPAWQQVELTAAGEIGPMPEPEHVGHCVTIRETDHLLGLNVAEMEAALDFELIPAHRDMMNRFYNEAQAGGMTPALCLHPDTDAKTAEVLLTMIDAIHEGSDLRYQAVDRWTTTATDGGGIALRDPITITYSLVPDGTAGEGTTSNLFAWLDGLYAGSGGRATWTGVIENSFARWGFVSGITYVEVADDGAAVNNNNVGILGVRGDVRIAGINIDGNGNVLAFNYFPNRGDMFLDSADNFYNSLTQSSRRLRNVVMHEHGHGMGLAHVEPISQTKLMEPFASTAFNGAQIDDRLGAQRLYGDRFENNDVFADANDLGAFGDGDGTRQLNLSIDDDSDVDFYQVELTTSGDLTVAAEIAANDYDMGPQGGTPVFTEYSSVHDIAMEIRDSGNNVIDSANSSGLGEDEVNTFSLAAGTYTIRLFPTTNTNEIQLYHLDIDFAEVITACPADLNNDGVADNGDIGAFIALFLGGDLAADFNNDGILDNGDIGAFIPIFLAGCP